MSIYTTTLHNIIPHVNIWNSIAQYKFICWHKDSLRNTKYMLTCKAILCIISLHVHICNHIAQYKPYVNIGNNIAYLRHRFIDCNGARTHNHLVHKWTLSYLAKLAKWLSCVVSTYLYGTFDYIFLSCHVRVSEWISVQLPECQGTLSSKQARYRVCFHEVVPWHSDNSSVWICSEMSTWYD